ncbi:MAG: hypothetical protein JSR59_21805 [Proteobacteria bacterium]|nr:hypothetical protein [Pseudomonadota bacterium]
MIRFPVAPRAALLALLCAFAGRAGAAAFAPNDVEVCSAAYGVTDPEFDSESRFMTFVNAQVQVRVALMNADGSIGTPGCVGVLVDQGAWGWPDSTGYQGPEWGRSANGLEIFYTRFLPDGKTPALAHAVANGKAWQASYLASGSRRSTIVASTDATAPEARIMYVARTMSGQDLPMWREAEEPASETLYPGSYSFSTVTGSVPRWVANERAISMVEPDTSGVMQAVRFDIDTQTAQVLTHDDGNKAEVWIWSAPEFGGDRVMTTVVDGCCLRVYRQLGSRWVLVNTIKVASLAPGLSAMYSPQPQVYKGRSYVVVEFGNQLKDPASQIWLLAIDPSVPLARQLSDPQTQAVRTEPETLVTKQGFYVYYSQQVGADQPRSLRRVSTGL